MTKDNEPGSRHSRWNWSPGDIVIIKKGDKNPVKNPDQTEDEAPAANDESQNDGSEQGNVNKRQ